PHSSGGAVRNESNWVEVLTCRPRCHEQRLTLQVVLELQHFIYCSNNRFLARQTSGTRHSTGKITFIRLNNVHTSRPQHLEILLRRRMIPHVDVHRRSKNNRRSRSKIECGQEIVRNASREFGNDVRSSGRDKQ